MAAVMNEDVMDQGDALKNAMVAMVGWEKEMFGVHVVAHYEKVFAKVTAAGCEVIVEVVMKMEAVRTKAVAKMEAAGTLLVKVEARLKIWVVYL
jgi:hypothetical protein